MNINEKTGRKILSLKNTDRNPKVKPLPVTRKEPDKKSIQKTRAKKRAAAGKWLRSFDVISELKPLKLGIHKDFLKQRPEGMGYKVVRQALAWHVRSKKYRANVDGMDATCERFDIEGKVSD